MPVYLWGGSEQAVLAEVVCRQPPPYLISLTVAITGYRGEMRRWSVHAGRYIHREVLTNQFSVRVKRGNRVDCTVLSVMNGSSADPLLRGWSWGVPAERVESHALFPRSWLVFREPLPEVNITIEQVSPVMPHCYSDTSLPTAVFIVSVENLSQCADMEVSVMLVIQNSDGTVDDPNGGYAHAPFSMSVACGAPEAQQMTAAGVCMARHRVVANGRSAAVQCDQGSMSLAVLTGMPGDVSTCRMLSTDVIVEGVLSAVDLWAAFSSRGEIADSGCVGTAPSGVAVAGAICKRFVVRPSATCEAVFSLSWDHPMARFGCGRTLPKYYTRFFGRSGLASPSISVYSLCHFEWWRREICEWQAPVNNDESLPAYYRHMLFNELYFLVDGGSIWLDTSDGVDNCAVGSSSDVCGTVEMNEVCECPCGLNVLESAIRQQSSIPSDHWANRDLWLMHDNRVRDCEGQSALVGQFLYLEGHEYLMYNTYDVHFYAGFALLMLFPQLELSLQRDFSRAVTLEDLTMRTMLGEGGKRPRKVAGCIPHDLGSPSEDPFRKTNIYNFQDVSMWKDLPSKFILQIYRNYKHTHAMQFLTDIYPNVLRVMEQALLFDKDNDGMIENEGFPVSF